MSKLTKSFVMELSVYQADLLFQILRDRREYYDENGNDDLLEVCVWGMDILSTGLNNNKSEFTTFIERRG